MSESENQDLSPREWLHAQVAGLNEPGRSCANRIDAILFHAMVLARRCTGTGDEKTDELAKELRERLSQGGW